MELAERMDESAEDMTAADTAPRPKKEIGGPYSSYEDRGDGHYQAAEGSDKGKDLGIDVDSETHQAHKDAEELDHVCVCNRVESSNKQKKIEDSPYLTNSPVIVNAPTNNPMSLPPTMMRSLWSPPSAEPESLFFHAAHIPTNRIRT
ncbi:hypothetical protein EYF80_010376 [Liparis tanakae]|uniref:Uncharacterized protein n=1 Tax=Liparis tanakae TaxID=230148 RepID=A0A4Z2IQ65_9TELE|nr:hypothetical protein EYF80_010376 [Liparis tanakae]